MKISLHWLTDFIEFLEHDPQIIADEFTRAVGEVDEAEEQGTYLQHCVVGKVITLQKHPKADRLLLCEVETDKGVQKVVCGGTNLREEMLVAFAHVGATVKWHGDEVVTLEQTTIRGEESSGMICAAEELDLVAKFPAKPEDGERAIIDLTNTGFTIGTPLKEALQMNDTILHIDNHAITNRPDLFSHLGVARELVALGLATWKKNPSLKSKEEYTFGTEKFTIRNTVEESVPAYEACVLKVDGTKETPEWMKKRLEATGWRPINIIVDITNYVLMEMGMPLHAFNADDFRGTPVIRKAEKGETIETLDGITRELPEGTIIMSDDAGIFDLFGIMGGKRTSSTKNTTTIFLQAGIIVPMAIRKTMIAMGHRTDAGTVYEKGLTKRRAEEGLLRAIELFSELCDAEILSPCVEWGEKSDVRIIEITKERIDSFIGIAIPEEKMMAIFADLGYTIATQSGTLRVTVPEWRRDVTMDQDLIEEIARIYRYKEIPLLMAEESITPPKRDHRLQNMRDSLKESGAIEFLHLAFTSPDQWKKCGYDLQNAIAIENPLGEELSLMRPALLPSLLETMLRELEKSDRSTLLGYEYGNVFQKQCGEQTALLLIGMTKEKDTLKTKQLLRVKQDIEQALRSAGHACTFVQSSENLPVYAHPAKSAHITLNGTVIGVLCELHPAILEAHKTSYGTACAAINLTTLRTLTPAVTIPRALPLFPSIELDVTFPLPSSFEELQKKLAQIDPLLTSVRLIDLYEKDDQKTITIRCTYSANDRTLTQAEVDAIHQKVLTMLPQEH